LPLLLAAKRRRYLRLAHLSLVQDEVPDLYGPRHGFLRHGFFLVHLPHLAHIVFDLDNENDTKNDPLGSNLVDCTDHHALQYCGFLLDDDKRGLFILRQFLIVPRAGFLLLLLHGVSVHHVPDGLWDLGCYPHEVVARVQLRVFRQRR